ncbi:MAG TPA: sugar ABC transporter permease [Micromonosporaceae bacterium]|nr:sugar ABC transporter permease [Micromonosporaceae bacterium]
MTTTSNDPSGPLGAGGTGTPRQRSAASALELRVPVRRWAGPRGADGPAPRRRPNRIYGRQGIAGWTFVAPAIVILGVFLLLPILMALFVSFTNWSGVGSPFSSSTPLVGASNYTHLFTVDGLAREDFMTSIRNNFYYVLLVVPLQTVLALALALVVNGRLLRGKGFFRTAFYFPSVTSSVAISVVFLFMFSNSGAVNALLNFFGIHGPQWFSDPRGVLQIILGGLGIVDPNNPPAALANSHFLSLSTWDWIAGPSVAMCAIITLVVWTTSGTFMLMFLAGLQNLPIELDEASMLDGATRWQRLRYVTLPQLKPTLFLVITLGLIGTWQVFDQIYVMSQGNPAKTTLTPAFLSYRTAFKDFNYGSGAAISFVLFLIIVLMTLLQRWVMRDRDKPPGGRRWFGRRPTSPPIEEQIPVPALAAAIERSRLP